MFGKVWKVGKRRSYLNHITSDSHFAESSFSWWIFFLLNFNLEATMFFFKFWPVIKIMPSHLWIVDRMFLVDRCGFYYCTRMLCLFPVYFLFDWSCQWLWLGATDLFSYQYFWAGFGHVVWTAFDLLLSKSFRSILFFFIFFADGNSWIGLSNSNYAITVFLQLSFASLWALLYWYALLHWYVMLTWISTEGCLAIGSTILLYCTPLISVTRPQISSSITDKPS